MIIFYVLIVVKRLKIALVVHLIKCVAIVFNVIDKEDAV